MSTVSESFNNDQNEPIVERTRSADDLIVKEEMQKLGKIAPDEPKPLPNEIGVDQEQDKKQESKQKEHPVKPANDDQHEPIPEAASDQKSDDQETTDEYGNSIENKKFYTEAEVQEMIRDRLKRVKNPDQYSSHNQPTQSQVQQAAQDFKADPQSEESWEVQLEKFIDNTLAKRESQRREQDWRRVEEQKQADFEIKFTSQMEKYKDFREVVSNKPVSEAMMRATMNMDNPAAFIYAACKTKPEEVERIAKIQDPYAQILEMGRLEERMKKSRALPVSPKPSTKITGDMSDDYNPARVSIDQLIVSHAKSKLK